MNDVTHPETLIDSSNVKIWHAETDVLIVGDGGAGINMYDGCVCTPFYPPQRFLALIIVDETGNRFINESAAN